VQVNNLLSEKLGMRLQLLGFMRRGARKSTISIVVSKEAAGRQLIFSRNILDNRNAVPSGQSPNLLVVSPLSRPESLPSIN
jgi:hypothetical protein